MNKCRLRAACFIIFGLMYTHTPAAGQDVVDGIYDDIRTGQLGMANAAADSALASYFLWDQPTLARLHAVRALLYSFEDNGTALARHFRLARDLDRALQLDPLFFSPALREQFSALPVVTSDRDTSTVAGEIRYLQLSDPRVPAAWRSAILPGWGQYYKQQKRRAWVVAGIAAGLGAGLIASRVAEIDARDRYLGAATNSGVQAGYDDYNAAYKLRRTLALTTGFYWLVNIADALFNLPTQAGINPASRTGGLQLHLTW